MADGTATGAGGTQARRRASGAPATSRNTLLLALGAATGLCPRPHCRHVHAVPRRLGGGRCLLWLRPRLVARLQRRGRERTCYTGSQRGQGVHTHPGRLARRRFASSSLLLLLLLL